MAEHVQVKLQTAQGAITVDKMMAPLLQAAWALGMGTLASCQGDPGKYPGYGEHDRNTMEFAYILFDDVAALEAFGKLFTRKRAWMLDVSWHSGRGATGLRGCVRFPQRDIPMITAALQSCLRGQRRAA